jgi:hypothetical protein
MAGPSGLGGCRRRASAPVWPSASFRDGRVKFILLNYWIHTTFDVCVMCFIHVSRFITIQLNIDIKTRAKINTILENILQIISLTMQEIRLEQVKIPCWYFVTEYPCVNTRCPCGYL